MLVNESMFLFSFCENQNGCKVSLQTFFFAWLLINRQGPISSRLIPFPSRHATPSSASVLDNFLARVISLPDWSPGLLIPSTHSAFPTSDK
jgi:hypothetical protein